MSDSFHFLRPLWFLMLVPLSLWLYWLWQVRARSDAWQQACDAHLLPHLLVQFGGSRQRLALWLLASGWLLAVLALAGPTWAKLPQPVFETEQARVLVLDLSRSMDATDIQPSRLMQAKFKLLDILKHSTEGQTALLAFAGDVHIVSPLTNDAETIASLVPTLDTSIMPVLGSNLLLALQTAGNLLKQGGATQGDIVLITDSEEDRAASAFAETLRQQGYRLSVLGVGTAQGAPIPERDGSFLKDSKGAIVVPRLDANALQQLAQVGGGLYVPYTADQRDVYYLLAPPADANFKQSQSQQTSDSWQEQGAWLLLMLLPIAALSFRRGWLLALLPVFFMLPPQADAGIWEDLWQRHDQQGQQALQAEHAQQAAQLFDTPDWQGVAQYRAGDYQAAAQSFAKLDTADGHYNQANALAKMGDLESALKAYNEALAKNPQHQLAQENKALVEKLLEQQKSQQDKPQNDKQDQQQGEHQQQPGENSQAQQQNASSPQNQADQNKQQSDAQNQQQQAQQAAGNPENGKQDEPSSAQQNAAQAPPDADKPAKSQAASADENQSDKQPTEEQIRQALKEQAEPQPQAEQPAQVAQAKDRENSAKGDEQTAVQAVQAQLSPEELQAQEKEVALEQWLNRVQDDPSGLLRRKFAWEYQKQQLEQQRQGFQQENAQGKTW